MKHTVTLAAMLLAAACVSPEAHREVVGANSRLQAQIADMAGAQKTLSAENARLREENRDLATRAADAAWIAEQKQKLSGLLEKYGAGTPSAAGGVELVQTSEGYAFRVAGGVLFSPGSNSLTEQGQRTLQELAAQLQGKRVRVEGHTDDTPIQRSQWGTNLRLSAERALVVADFLTGSAGLKAADVSIAGYSQYRPAVEGTDDAARQKNRRVEILMLGT
jgi:chemotaxis protein MotB